MIMIDNITSETAEQSPYLQWPNEKVESPVFLAKGVLVEKYWGQDAEGNRQQKFRIKCLADCPNEGGLTYGNDNKPFGPFFSKNGELKELGKSGQFETTMSGLPLGTVLGIEYKGRGEAAKGRTAAKLVSVKTNNDIDTETLNAFQNKDQAAAAAIDASTEEVEVDPGF